MPSGRDDDLDWLYDRNSPPAAEPEPTRILPPGMGVTSLAPGGATPTPAEPRLRAAHPVSGPADQTARPYPEPVDRPRGGGPNGPILPAPNRPRKKRHPVRNALLALMILVLLMVVDLVGVPAYAWSQVQRVDEAPAGDRPADQPGQTLLLVGSDSREGLSAAEQKRLGTGSTKGRRTDTMMILYIPPGGQPVLISLPRDSYVSIPKNGKNKINAAYAFGGAKLLVATVEQNTGLRMDGYLEIGFGGFVNIIDALGGIEMCLPEKIKDRDSHIDLPKGCQTLAGTDALGYVRMRKADPRGDLGRVERQRQMLAAVAKKGATPASILNPARYWKLSNAAAQSVSLGEDTSFPEMVSLGLAMKKVSSGEGLTLTVPIGDANASTSAGSAVLWDDKRAKAMFADIARGDTADLAQYAK